MILLDCLNHLFQKLFITEVGRQTVNGDIPTLSNLFVIVLDSISQILIERGPSIVSAHPDISLHASDVMLTEKTYLHGVEPLRLISPSLLVPYQNLIIWLSDPIVRAATTRLQFPYMDILLSHTSVSISQSFMDSSY
jgi:hypothetical protein